MLSGMAARGQPSDDADLDLVAQDLLELHGAADRAARAGTDDDHVDLAVAP